jgi:hypothetical protein
MNRKYFRLFCFVLGGKCSAKLVQPEKI